MTEENKITEHTKKCFKDYYNKPEWKEKHLNYIKEKVRCECGKSVCRSNLSTHKKSHIHADRMKALNDNPDYKDTLKKIEEAYQTALNEIHSTNKTKKNLNIK